MLAIAAAACASAPTRVETPVQAPALQTDSTLAQPTVVVPEFGWRPGVAARVQQAQRIVRKSEGGGTDISMRSSYAMVVEAHDQGLLVRNYDGQLLDMTSDPPSPADDELEAMYRALSGVKAAYVVSEDGELLELEGVDEAAAAFRSALVSALDSVAETEEMAPLMEMFEGMLSPAAMFSLAEEQWNGMIWNWAWEEFEEGAVYEATSEEPSPLVPDVAFPMEYEFGFLEFVPCRPQEQEPRCVSLEMYAYPDSEAAKEIMAAFFQRMGAAMQGATLLVDEFVQVNHIAVVLDPVNMLPYAYHASKSIEGVISENGKANPFSRLDQTELTFEYVAGAR